ncbi:MAG: KH domain-containing protein, partial [Clostridiales bacterium]|nr:KH domain-containing protein [Clostridiales bacterium]
DLFAERDSHKAIIIGEGGEMLRRINTHARQDIEKLLGCKVYTETFVKIRRDWRNRPNIMGEVGYDLKDEH